MGVESQRRASTWTFGGGRVATEGLQVGLWWGSDLGRGPRRGSLVGVEPGSRASTWASAEVEVCQILGFGRPDKYAPWSMTHSVARPSLKIVGLHVEGYRALRRVDWPADGLGWGDAVPDIVMVGGVNGSGKTTLLELIAEAAQCLFLPDHQAPMTLSLASRVCFELEVPSWGKMAFQWPDWSDEIHTKLSRLLPSPEADAITRDLATQREAQLKNLRSTIADADAFAKSDIPGVIYLPTDRRLVIPPEPYKAAGKWAAPYAFFYKFKASTQWRDSLEALLYGARWADLNAKEDGHPERATHFRSYSEAFQAFFGDAKQLVWENGELFVKINDTGALHPLMELSSGEKQAVILAAELYRCWRPGSLILIDEPELHFHPTWQTAFYVMLDRWQKERGGQVIIATQSTHLFRIAAPDTAVLLGGPLA